MSDKEILFQAANKYVRNTVSSLFGIQTIATDTLITYVLKNAEERWGNYVEPFLNGKGNIDIDILKEAFNDAIRVNNGFHLSFLGKTIKFSEKDVEEFVKIFKTLKANNG